MRRLGMRSIGHDNTALGWCNECTRKCINLVYLYMVSLKKLYLLLSRVSDVLAQLNTIRR